MFETSDVTGYGPAETLAAVSDVHVTRKRAEVALLELGLHFADLHPDPASVPGYERVAGGEAGIVYGGEGCPAIGEFAAADFGAAIERSSASASLYLGQCLALRHRFPRMLAQIRSGHAEPWKARQIVADCLSLSAAAADYVDARVASIIDTITPGRLTKIVKAAKWHADPDAARAEAEAQARSRGVSIGSTDDHGTTTLFVRASTGDVIHIDATLRQLADALKAIGDSGTLAERKARAIGIIADPALAHELLKVAHHLAANPFHPGDETSAADKAGAAPDETDAENQDRVAAAEDQAENQDRAAATENQDRAPAPGSAASPGDEELSLGDVESSLRGTAWLLDEPDLDDEADRDPPHPSAPASDHLNQQSAPRDPAAAAPAEPGDPGEPTDPAGRGGRFNASGRAEFGERGRPRTASMARGEQEESSGIDVANRRMVEGKLAKIKQAAYRQGIGSTGRRPGRVVLYAHITDETLIAGGGVARVEGYGPVYTARLEELLGHSNVVIQPVIDLNKKASVDAYEIPHRIRERVKLINPVELFVYGTRETTNSTDLDHIIPYDFTNRLAQQTCTRNLAPLSRFSHRIKTLGGWKERRLGDGAIEWTTRYGFKYRVDHTGTHPIVGEL